MWLTEDDIKELEIELETVKAKGQAALANGEIGLFAMYKSEASHLSNRIDNAWYEIEAERKSLEEQCQ